MKSPSGDGFLSRRTQTRVPAYSEGERPGDDVDAYLSDRRVHGIRLPDQRSISRRSPLRTHPSVPPPLY
ncbi:hypothetical protein LshimejAT787_1201060 [Lyophyllum shimeji]|uniref:Uncharacterized protein n=1 Tax=Lyophyllum shimeji TaxID=47721 RepID=A0A9P3URX0_LYOSH|nr:hypothetical protein LshimejAT787_1201060 [Lyophyllum shimeji]